MKTVIMALFLPLASCHFSTAYGQCISPFEDGLPDLKYRIDAWNTVWSVLGFEMIFPPAVWILSAGKCPVAEKEQR